MFINVRRNEKEAEVVKENAAGRAPLSALWALGGLAAVALALLAAQAVERALPAALGRDAPPQRFSGERAHAHVAALAALGPRVAGSPQSEAAAVALLAAELRRVARGAAPHNRVDVELHAASGAFSLTFLDGMANVYRDVQSVVARVRGAGGAAGASRPALLLNCHYDSVPDSPGASDDAAGCAVLLETLRALAARRAPLRHDAVFLFNGAEENIMQASHAFVTAHRWARAVRAFVNIEACGAGGREVLFQAGPGQPWLLEAYASAVPHPFASSLAQELFESGVIPGDTDFRIFRDFGNLSGVDLAWASNGYVYHTRLDTAERVPPAALQRTGDNVLALAERLLQADELGAPAAEAGAAAAPVYFDVLGARVVLAGARASAAAALATLALVALKVQASAREWARRLGRPRRAWWRRVGVALAGGAAAHALGLAAALLPALLLHAARARLLFYARPALLLPLYALPALAGTWAAALWMGGDGAALAGGAQRHWWRARAWHDALAAAAALAVAAGAAAGLRSAFVPLLWALPAAAADLAADGLPGAGGGAHRRARAGPRGRGRGRRGARRRRRRAHRRAGRGLVRLAAARAGRHAARGPPARRGGGAGGAGRRGRAAGRARGALLAGAAAAAHGVPRAPHAARAGRGARGLPLLGARAGRQHAALGARPGAGTESGAARGGLGLRPLAVLRRALLPAGAVAAARVALGARAARARRAPGGVAGAGRAAARGRRAAPRAARAPHGAQPRGAAAGAAGGRAAAPHRRGRGRGRGRGPAAAGGPPLGRAAHVLRGAARRPRRGAARRAGGVEPAPGAARPAGAARGRPVGGRVAGGPRALRAARQGGRPRPPAGRLPRLGGRHRLGRRPAPLPPLAARCAQPNYRCSYYE